MSKLIIPGSCRIDGSITIQGAKNSALALLSASLLTEEKLILHNCPRIADVEAALEILKGLGCAVTFEDNTLEIDSSQLKNYTIPDELMRKMRSSVIFLGSMVARMRKAVISCPGGCELGPRPIDLHISALKKLGVEFDDEGGEISAFAPKLAGAGIHLAFPSVGATENAILAAALADGTTKIYNAAREPEITDLQNLLNCMGGKVSGAGTSAVEVTGVAKLHGAEYTIMPDRIAAATYLTMAAETDGRIEINGVNADEIFSVVEVLRQSGAEVDIENHRVALRGAKRYKAMGTVRTFPYPGFPTDALACMMAYAATADGMTLFVENIFQNRFKQATELERMGAKIRCEGRIALVEGVGRLFGTNLEATDLRGGAALVTAALKADGESVIEKAQLIERGYEDMPYVLSKLGVQVRKE